MTTVAPCPVRWGTPVTLGLLLGLAIGCSNVPTTTPTIQPTGVPSAVPNDSPTNLQTAPPTLPPTAAPSPERTPEVVFILTSTAFADGGAIPSDYTCDGADQPPPLSWSDAPAGTAEFALVMDDPDARGFVHWVVIGIPASATSLGASWPASAREGRTDFGRVGYGGPCPPSGTHRYVTTLYALSAPLGLSGTVSAADVRRAAQGVTLATAVLTGTYRRAR